MIGLNAYLEHTLKGYTDADEAVYKEDVLHAVSCAAAANEFWLVPVEPLPDGSSDVDFAPGLLLEQAPGFLRKTIKVQGKTLLLCAFTSQEMLHGEDEEILHIIYPAKSILEELVRADVDGMALNPWGDSVILKKEDAEKALKDAEEIDKSELLSRQAYLVSPRAVIDTGKILADWQEGWEKGDIENWRLIAYPIMPDGRILLLFEMREYYYGRNGARTEDFVSYYRVLEYKQNMDGPELVGKYRFKMDSAYVFTVFLMNGELKACVRANTGLNYTVLPMIPENDDGQFKVFRYVERLIVDSTGNVIVGYDKNLMDKARWPLMVFDPQGEETAHYFDAQALQCRDVNLDGSEKIWFHLFPSDCLISWEPAQQKSGKHTVALQGFDAFALSRDQTRLFVFFSDLDGGSVQYILSRNSDGDYVNPIRFEFAPMDKEGNRLEPQDCEVFGRCSTMKSWVILNADGKLYLYDVDDCCEEKAPAQED